MTNLYRLKLPGEVAGRDFDQDDPLAAATSGFGVSVLSSPPAQSPPVITVGRDDVIVVDLTEAIHGPAAIAVHGSSAVKSGGGGGLLTTYTSGAPGGYNVTISFKGTWTSGLQSIFTGVADRISTIITADVPDVLFRGIKIDDILITAELKAIDGVGGILGQAGPTALRSGSYLPAAATMQFDSADADNYNALGLFDEIVTHEMLHSIGFGSIWSYLNLVSGPTFIGAHAQTEYDRLVDAFNVSKGYASNTVSALAVPLETGGSAGTAGSHWSEAIFKNELMTGYINTTAIGGMVVDPLSALTIASLWDLGYAVSAGPANAYYLT